ncbi:metal ABC transporter ATP-binding protein [Methanothermococcus sp.]|uniref:metal ABC transporter ATP-binding protein n=1 Tax=Methanothermococcus sp. TaxID=2614238 RepID=UPI0025CDD949|nr:metal ABC transporter ATP-binding protein [Methanothermococcus sp.]
MIKNKKDEKDKIILNVEDLNVILGNERIIENLSFKVKKGEFLTIIGPNGSGKTTLLRALFGILPYEGKVEWRKNVKISYLPQRLSKKDFSYVPISIKEFFKFKNVLDEDILNMLNSVGLENSNNLLDMNPDELSGGQFQRMLVAWSLIDNPDVLLFDEPTTGIDIGGEKTIYELLYKFWKDRNLTILLITHDLNIVFAYSTNCLCLHKEKKCYGPPKEILTPERLQEIYGTKIKFYKHTH